MKQKKYTLTAVLLLLCLLAQAAFPVCARAYDDMTTSEAGVELIKRYESYSPQMYYENGHWYVGYGIQVKEGAYPNGVTEEEAEALLREHLAKTEQTLNRFFAKNYLQPTQPQFDALVDFTYTAGDAWLSGSSALLKIVRGEKDADRLETAHAFGVWSHAGGKVLPGLADRRLEEAALYFDGAAEAKDLLCWLSVERRSGVICPTDFAVYERGSVYDAFPTMFLLGYTLTGVRTSSGDLISLGDTVEGSFATTPIWEKNIYTGSFSDVQESNWFYDYVMELSEGGVIGGRGDGSFDPASPVTVGEALKLVLLAAGAEEQSATGTHWASGYADYARTNGILPDELLADLDAPILRLDVARLAAGALGYGQSFSAAPFSDVDDTYVTALYEAGVLTGMEENGETVYHPDQQLTRAEISTIVWRLRNTVSIGAKQMVRYGSREIDVVSGAAFNRYDKNAFTGEGAAMSYTSSDVTALRGVDVSKHQGSIDWNAAAQGIDFAILRVGGRFWGSGSIYEDTLFEEFYAGAEGQGLRLGYYFYSQAITPEEAVEEADFVIEKLQGKRVDAPVVFDWETAGADEARTNGLPVSVVCDCAVAFCERIKAAGYTPMVYMNTYDGYIKYDVSRLADYDIWYAGQYNGAYPRFIYDFKMWQYTSSGKLDGINGSVDMDLWFLR